MNFEPLIWDSDFFKWRIARLVIDVNDSVDDWKSKLLSEKYQYDLIYIFTNEPLKEALCPNGCVLVDKKIIYAGSTIGGVSSLDVFTYNKSDVCSDLEYLAWVSAGHSRYKMDSHFGDAYKRLYSCWIKKSVSGQLADVVLCHGTENKINGMLTIKRKGNIGEIGLVAVHPDSHSCGIGTLLMDNAKYWLASRNIYRVEVATQNDNFQACRFYEKQGLQEKSFTYVYHYWVN